MEYRNYLNEEQLKGVTCLSQYTSVVAGAGSGKTRVLTYRIAYLMEKMNALDSQILGITFTNKAAKEIKDRVLGLIPNAQHMHLSTIHSWCARFLRIYIDAIGYPKNFTILDEDDRLQVMKNLFVEHGKPKNDPSLKNCINWISKKKGEGYQYVDIANETYPNPEIREYQKFFGYYDERLKKINSLDFDDLILKAIEVLSSPNGIRERVCARLKHILVDEFQDINDLQFELITLLMNRETSLYVVGDPDQTIYTWRGANNYIMLHLEEELKAKVNKDAQVNQIYLLNNYRSTSNILESANKLIKHNQDRFEKDLKAINGQGKEIELHRSDSKNDEAAYIASIIKDGYAKNKKYSDFAILYRANYLTRELEAQLVINHIPYRVFGGMKFFQRKEIKDILAYLSLFTNNDNDIAFERIINVPKRNIGESSLETLKEEALRCSTTLYYFVKENLDESSLNGKKRIELRKLISTIDKYQQELDNAPSYEFGSIVEQFISEIEYYEYLKAEDEDKGDERIENVKELIGSIQEFFKVNPTLEFSAFIENAALQSSSDDINDGDYVSLMTVHTAKGLEFNTVFIYAFNDGVFPSAHSLEDAHNNKGEEEERRLAYVAITRAKTQLYITCDSDYSYVMQSRGIPSRFIKEAGLFVPSALDNNLKPYMSSYNNSAYKTASHQNFSKPFNNGPSVNVSSSNGIKNWKVGDKIVHDNFGIGEVVAILSDKLFKVRFVDPEYGEKTLLSSHIKIKRLVS